MNFHKNKKQLLINSLNDSAHENVRDVDMVPMINVVFLLLTFFMIAGVFRTIDSAEVTIPTTQLTLPSTESETPQIAIDASGALSINGVAYPTDQLPKVMSELDNTRSLVVRADATAPANTVIAVFSAAKAAGFKEVGLQALGGWVSPKP